MKKTFAAALKELEKRKEAIGKERDKLRDFVHEYESLLEVTEEALGDIDQAIDKLSELV